MGDTFGERRFTQELASLNLTCVHKKHRDLLGRKSKTPRLSRRRQAGNEALTASGGIRRFEGTASWTEEHWIETSERVLMRHMRQATESETKATRSKQVDDCPTPPVCPTESSPRRYTPAGSAAHTTAGLQCPFARAQASTASLQGPTPLDSLDSIFLR
jgi:hypothetical protein